MPLVVLLCVGKPDPVQEPVAVGKGVAVAHAVAVAEAVAVNRVAVVEEVALAVPEGELEPVAVALAVIGEDVLLAVLLAVPLTVANELNVGAALAV